MLQLPDWLWRESLKKNTDADPAEMVDLVLKKLRQNQKNQDMVRCTTAVARGETPHVAGADGGRGRAGKGTYQKANQQAPAQPTTGTQRHVFRCTGCGEYGHLVGYCKESGGQY